MLDYLKSHKIKKIFFSFLIFSLLFLSGINISKAVTGGATEPEVNIYEDPKTQNLSLTYTSPNEKFLLHYTTSGANAVSTTDEDNDGDPDNGLNGPNGTPDYIDLAAKELDYVYGRIITSMSYSLTGDSLTYNVYFANLGSTTNPYPGYVQAVNDWYSNISATYMVLDNNYTDASFAKYGPTPENILKATVAQQFYYAVQDSYNTFYTDDSGANSWWKHATAIWMVDQIYPGLDSYLNYTNFLYSGEYYPKLYGYFASPELGLAYPTDASPIYSGDSMDYGRSMFAKYLAQKAGGGTAGQAFIRSIWSGINNHGFYDSNGNPTAYSITKIINTKLGGASTNLNIFNSVFADYAVQNYLLDAGKTPALKHYSSQDVTDIKNARDDQWTEYPSYVKLMGDSNTGAIRKTVYAASTGAPQYLGVNYYRINAPTTSRTIQFDFTGHKIETDEIDGQGNFIKKPTYWIVKLLLEKQDGTYEVSNLVSNGTAKSITKSGFGKSSTYKSAVLVVIPVAPYEDGLDYTYGYTISARWPSIVEQIKLYKGTSSSNTYQYGSTAGIVVRASLKDKYITSANMGGKTPPILQKSATATATSWTTADAAMSWNSTLNKYVSDPQKPSKKMYYRVFWPGDASYAGATSQYNYQIYVQPKISLALSSSTVGKGVNVKLSGTLLPNHAGKYLYIQYNSGSGWKTYTLRKAKLSSSSSFITYWNSSIAGTYKLRMKFNSDGDHYTAYSPEKQVVVK